MVRQSPTRQCEALVEAAELLPHGFRHEQPVALTHRTEPPAARRRRERGRREQPVAVLLPVELREQLVLDPLVVARGLRVHVAGRADVPPERRHDRARRELAGEQRARQQAGAGETGPVDEEPDEIALRHLDADVGRAGGRRRRGIDPHAAQPAGKRFDHRRVDRVG